MFTYNQSTGEFLQDGSFIGTGYSGMGLGRNNPDAETIKNLGPIPKGLYIIGEPHDEIPGLGPCIFYLTPDPNTDIFGRSAFYIHGNNTANNASHGCIILGPAIRHLIADSSDQTLLVISAD